MSVTYYDSQDELDEAFEARMELMQDIADKESEIEDHRREIEIKEDELRQLQEQLSEYD